MSLLNSNQPCPCGSATKYKKCCKGKIDWEDILRKRPSDGIPHLTVRGRNLGFLNRVDSILGLSGTPNPHWGNVKEAMSVNVVRDIAEAVTQFWPKNTDVSEALKRSNRSNIAALHLGTQQSPEYVLNTVARHALYADKILIFDPIVHPLSVKPEFSALHNPQEHVFNTLKHLRTWYALSPWIEAGIVELIRGPSDFDHRLQWDLIVHAEQRGSRVENLDGAIAQDIENLMESSESNDLKLLYVLGLPDHQLAQMFLSAEKSTSTVGVDDFIRYVRSEEQKHPYFIKVEVDGKRVSQITTTTSGASYAEGSMVANITNSYLFTDLRSRWMEVQNDRAISASARIWDPFSKAFSDAKIPTFESIPLEFALRLRQEGRLDALRSFLRQVWKAGQISDFDEREAAMFADKFKDELQIAKSEWTKINSDLVKWVGAESLVASVAAAFSTGEIIPAAGWALAATAQIASSTLNRHNFRKRYPAAMFLGINK